MSNEIIEIRWHGRGGQGAITAAKVVAQAAFLAGYGGAVMAPTFGTERRGAPVHTSLKIAREKITDLSPIKCPDIVVVLDYMITSEVDVTAGLKPNGLVVINTNRPAATLGLDEFRIATVDVATIAEAAGLRRGVINTGIIGAFGRASGLITIDLLAECIEQEFQTRRPRENAQAARDCYQQTQITD